jgi:serine/threonine protein kinase
MPPKEPPFSSSLQRPRGGDTMSESSIDEAASAPVAPRSALQPGAVVKHYELIRRLGAGGMGVVFLARDVRLERLVAIKFLRKHTGESARRLLSEARLTARCRHENIVILYGIDEIDERPYMVLEYIEGRTLRDAMRKELVHSVSAAVALMLPVARALSAAHEMGVVHRDLKPENILLSDADVIKVLDFGIAKQLELDQAWRIPTGDAQVDMPLTRDGRLAGTLPYMAPEQWLQGSVDERADIWAVGLMLFELVTGAHPIHPPTPHNLATVRDLDEPMPSARERLHSSPELAALIDHCLKKRKEERLSSARALVEALAQLGERERSAAAFSKRARPFAGLSASQEGDAARAARASGRADAGAMPETRRRASRRHPRARSLRARVQALLATRRSRSPRPPLVCCNGV